jgi:hypothetical protein
MFFPEIANSSQKSGHFFHRLRQNPHGQQKRAIFCPACECKKSNHFPGPWELAKKIGNIFTKFQFDSARFFVRSDVSLVHTSKPCGN